MESLVRFVLFTFAVYGLANAIAVLKIGRFIFGTVKERKFLGRIPYLGDLFYCPPCVAFWVGMAMSWFILSPAAVFVGVKWQAMVMDGLAVSGLSYLLHMVAERLGHGLDV